MKILSLEAQLRLQQIKKYGPGSEKLDSAQLELLELEPGVSRLEVRAESQREPLPAARAKSRKHPGRQELPAELPRVERVIACTPEQRTCKASCQETAVIGYETSEQLDVEPAKYFVVVTKREKRACKCCQEGGVTAAAAPARIVERGLASDRVVIDTVVAKYSDHLPLYRQSAILDREAGVEISRATLDGWVMRVGELLIPIVSVMRRELLGGSYLQADETTVDVQMHDGSGHNHQAIAIAYDDPLLSGTPGSVLTFTGTMTNNTDSPVFLNQGSVNLASPFDSPTDVSVELLDWPISLDPSSTSADLAFFTVTIPDPFPGAAGPYDGTLLAQGGADGNALDSLNDPTDASFAVDVTELAAAAPEPGTFTLFVCFAAMAGLKYVLRFMSLRTERAAVKC
jgi:transposase